jgi:chemotaxis protein MotB
MVHSNRNLDYTEENPFVLSLGDLMASLLLIFALLLSSSLLRLEDAIGQRKRQVEMINQQELVKRSIIAELIRELKEYDVDIDPKTGVIRIKEGVLFEFGKAQVKESGRAFLKSFVAKYAHILLQKPAVVEQLSQIILEGHTDNTGTYEYNLKLSLERANNVASYIFSPEFGDFPCRQQLQTMLTANGRSFVEPRDSNLTDEGRARNRRVEFKFRLKDWDMVEPIKKTFSTEAAPTTVTPPEVTSRDVTPRGAIPQRPSDEKHQ